MKGETHNHIGFQEETNGPDKIIQRAKHLNSPSGLAFAPLLRDSYTLVRSKEWAASGCSCSSTVWAASGCSYSLQSKGSAASGCSCSSTVWAASGCSCSLLTKGSAASGCSCSPTAWAASGCSY